VKQLRVQSIIIAACRPQQSSGEPVRSVHQMAVFKGCGVSTHLA
jgi:hypothetical protein